jgi:hypothetical protein
MLNAHVVPNSRGLKRASFRPLNQNGLLAFFEASDDGDDAPVMTSDDDEISSRD